MFSRKKSPPKEGNGKLEEGGSHCRGRNRVCRCRLAWGLTPRALPAPGLESGMPVTSPSLGLNEAWELWGEV